MIQIGSTAFILFSLSSFIVQPRLQKTYIIYDENCSPKFQMIVGEKRSKIIERETNLVINSFSNEKNPYLKEEGMDYLIYVVSEKYSYKYLGIKDNSLFDLKSNEKIILEESKNQDIHSSLKVINYSDIPNDAVFCRYSYYFEHLKKDGFGENKDGTCAIISSQILLGYYDSIATDHVIEECYDLPVSEYKQSCNLFSVSPASNGQVFHDYLVNYCSVQLNINVLDRGLSNSEQFRLMNSYIGAVRGLEFQNNTSEGNLSDIMSGRQFGIVKNGIKEGRPVILNTLHHSMVAFAYDETYAYLMTGWYSPVIAKLKWNDFKGNVFNNQCGAADLFIYSKHQCSNNYYSTYDNKYLCPVGVWNG